MSSGRRERQSVTDQDVAQGFKWFVILLQNCQELRGLHSDADPTSFQCKRNDPRLERIIEGSMPTGIGP
jgi:hypothetical protein